MILLYECYVIILSKVEETKSVKEIFCVSSESDSGPDLVDQKIEKLGIMFSSLNEAIPHLWPSIY